MTPLITNSGKSQVALHGDIHDPVETLDNGREEKRALNLPIDGSAQRTGMRPVGSRSARQSQPYLSGNGDLYTSPLFSPRH
jgi:hypothetical protein